MPINISVDYNNPLAPSTTASSDELMNSYHQYGSMIRGESQQSTSGKGYNPFGVDQQSQQDAQQQHISNMEQFLAPIKMNQESGQMTDDHRARLEHHITNDPAIKEIEPMLMEHLATLKGGIDSGDISPDQAHEIFMSFGQSVIDPILDKHHGKHSDSHHSSLFDDIPTEKADIVKRAQATTKGAK